MKWRKKLLAAFAILFLANLFSVIRIEAEAIETVYIEWSESQKNVLHSTLIDEGRIEKRAFMPNELRLLNVVEAVDTLLAERYPDAQLVLTGLKTIAFGPVHYNFKAADDAGNRFTVQVTTQAEDLSDIAFDDSYYPIYKDSVLESYVHGVVDELGLKDYKLYCGFYGLYDNRYDPELPLADVLSAGLPIYLTGTVYTTHEAARSFDVDEAVKVTASCGLSGHLVIWALDELPEGTPDDEWYSKYCRTGNAQQTVLELKARKAAENGID